MKIRLLLINAIDVTKDLQTSLPPLSLGYLVSALRKKYGETFFEFKIIDREIGKGLKEFKPDIVGITAVSQNYNYAMAYAKMAKKYKIPVLMGGIHISVLPTTLTRDMTVGVIGEGEDAIVELLAIYLKKRSFVVAELKMIKGLVYWDGKKLIQTEKRKPISLLNSISRPARDLIKIEKCTHVFSSRGCPYRCVFCASSRFWNTTRTFSAQYVVKEIKELYEDYDVREIDFWDDLFIVNKKRIQDIVRLLKKEGLLGKIVFSCAVRSNLIDESMVRLLKKMGVKNVSMGLESGSPRILDFLKGSTINIKNHAKAVRLLKKYQIEPSASFIIGSPDETREEILQTFKFIKDSKLRGFGVYVLTPLPGTPIWEYAKKRKLVNEKMDWSKLNVEFLENYEQAIILSETLSKNELHQLILMFKREQEIRHLVDMIKHPVKILRVVYHFFRDGKVWSRLGLFAAQ